MKDEYEWYDGICEKALEIAETEEANSFLFFLSVAKTPSFGKTNYKDIQEV